MKRALRSFILLFIAVVGSLNTWAKERIAIIGAGPAGIKAATLLQQKGTYDVVVFCYPQQTMT